MKPVIILSNPSSTKISIQVTDVQGTASGESTILISINVLTMTIILQEVMIMFLDHTMLISLLDRPVLHLMFP